MRYRYTQFFVNGLPVDYNITIKENEFIFEPGYNPHEDLKAPSFRVKKQKDILVFENLDDDSLKHQVEEEIMEYLKKDN